MTGALSREVLTPDHVVLTLEDDGLYHLLLYVGKSGAGFVFLKEIVLSPEHAVGLGIGAYDEVEASVATEDPRVTQVSGLGSDVCHCGQPRMPSGWCIGGHAPS